jgi:hypothetical protein
MKEKLKVNRLVFVGYVLVVRSRRCLLVEDIPAKVSRLSPHRPLSLVEELNYSGLYT